MAAVDDMPRWQDRLELATGRAQLTVIRAALARVAGLKAGVFTGPDLRMPYLQRRGAGLPLVCIHGFGGDKGTWLMVAPLLARRRGLVMMDLPGHGDAGDLGARSASLRSQADAVVQLLDHLGHDRAIIVGNSMGGGVAQRLAVDHPARVAALVLIASVGPEVEASAIGQALRRGDNPLIPTSPADTEAFVRLMVEKPPPVPRAVQRYVADLRVRSRHRLAAVIESWRFSPREDDLPADLGVIDQPALIIQGARDRVIPRATAEALTAGLPRATLTVLAGIGHAPQLEAARRVASLIDDFVRALP